MEDVLLKDLRRRRKRFLRWMMASLVFATAVSALAFLTSSKLFGAVAAFLWFFAWNRWMEWRRTEPLLRRPESLDESDLALWQRIAFHYFRQQPRWKRISDRIAATLAIALLVSQFLLISILGSPALRLFYFFIAVVISLIFVNALSSHLESRKKNRRYSAFQHEFWKELT